MPRDTWKWHGVRECFHLSILLLWYYKYRKIRKWSDIAFLVGIMDRQTYALSIEPSLNPQCWNMMLLLLLYFSSGFAELMEILLYTHVPFYPFYSQKGTYSNSCIISWKRDLRMAREYYHIKLVLFFLLLVQRNLGRLCDWALIPP